MRLKPTTLRVKAGHRSAKLNRGVITPGTALAKYEAARTALAQAKSVDEVKHIRNSAEAVRAYARQAKDRSLEMDAAEIRIRAERRLGQMMEEQKRTVGLAKGGGDKKSDHRVKRRPGDATTLAEAGIDKHLANRSRRWAAMSDSEFAMHLVAWRAESERAASRVTLGILKAAAAEQRLARFQQEMTQKQKDFRRDFGPFWALNDDEDEADDETPKRYSSLELDRQRYERLLHSNPVAPAGYPSKRYDSIVKIVAEAMVRFGVISNFIEQPNAPSNFVRTMNAMDDRIDRLLAAIAKAAKTP
jgi:hypothetical protein